MRILGFRDWGLRFRVLFRVEGARVEGLGFRN